MYDIYCPHCGEPHETDRLHSDVNQLHSGGYERAAKAFTVVGCALFSDSTPPMPCQAAPVVSQAKLASIQAAHDLGDYPDDWDYYAADLDAGLRGWHPDSYGV